LKFVNVFIVAAIALLSIAAGLAKVMHSPQEMEFLQGLGLSSFLIMVFGLVQITGGVLIAPKTTRLPGAILVALRFCHIGRVDFYRRQCGVWFVFANTCGIGGYDYLPGFKNHTEQTIQCGR
jgi:hypothetical protein